MSYVGPQSGPAGADLGVLRIEQTLGVDVVRVAVSGEVDSASGPFVREAVTGAVRAGATSVELDLSGVSFMDSSGIRDLLVARDEAGGVLRLWRLSDPIRRVLELSGLSELFEEEPPVST